jgi:hypothetical protein
MQRSRDVSFPGPGFRDWLLLGIGLAFVAMGVLIVPKHRDGGIVTIALFGTCAAIAAFTVVRKLRQARLEATRVEVVGGVPIRPSRAVVGGVGASMLALGAILIVFSRGYGLLFWACAWFVAGVGALLSVGVATGRLPAGYLQLDPDGITIGMRRWSYTVAWDRIARVAPGELHDNAVLLIWIDRPEDVVVRPAQYQSKAHAALCTNLSWVGAHLVVMTGQYRMDLPLLLKAIERYVSDPSSRAQLARPRLPQHGEGSL